MGDADRRSDGTRPDGDRPAGTDAAADDQAADALKRALRAVKDMKVRVARAEDAAHEPIAIVGIGCRLPGADDPEHFWRLLHDGVDAIGDVPSDRWDVDEYYDPDPTAPGKMVSRSGGFIDDVDLFDPQFFGITPREAVSMDPQQRLLIEVAWEALESAGIAPSSLSGSLTATFVGMTPGDYSTMGTGRVDQGVFEIDAYLGTGNAMSVAAGRISYALGLHGPNLALDTACSSSLVAVHLGVQSLRRGEADAAIVGGVNLMLDPTRTIYMSQAGALSPTGRCHTFDASADGYVRGEGCGVVVLKRLSDALTDGDNVLAVVHGSAVNHDGRSGGLTVPNGHAQQAVIRAALADARLEPASVSYVEAHGTGTPLGDPIEARALDAVYGSERDGTLLIGSAKTNIGHLEAAAGIAGLLKLVLSLQHGMLPAHLHFDQPSPHIEWAETCLEVTARPVAWVDDGRPRLAGLSSFGLSGTNCHLIVGDPPATAASAGTQGADAVGTAEASGLAGPRVVTLSARSSDTLTTLAGAMASALDAPDAPSLADVAYTLNTGRNELAHRLAVVATDRDEAARALARHVVGERDPSVVVGDVASASAPKIAFLFSGQGAQYAGMGRELYEANAAFRAAIDECDERFQPHLGRSLRSLIHPPAGTDSPIDDTTYTQPALFALEYALAQLWAAWGVRPDMMLGHSIGGLVAAHLDGIMSLDDAVQLVAERGRLMGSLPPGGSMVAVFSDEATVAAALPRFEDRVTIAAINGPDNVVISGPHDDVTAAAVAFGEAGVETRPLTTSHAFHSPLMDPVLADFESIAQKAQLTHPRGRRLVSDNTGALGDQAMATAEYWVRHLREPVRFADGIATLHDAGCNVFVEIGPSPTLTVMGQRCIPDAGSSWLPSLVRDRPEATRVLTTLAELWTHGVGIDWRAFDPPGSRRRVPLPTTPFQRDRYWLPEPSADHVGAAGGHPLLGTRSSSSGPDVRFDAQVTPTRATFLSDYRAHGRTELPAVAHAETLLAAGRDLWGHDVPLVVTDLEVHGPLEVGGPPLHHQTIASPVGRSDAAVSVDVCRTDTGEWDHLADGHVSIDRDRPAPEPIDPGDLRDGLQPASVDDLFATWADAGLVLGERFHCVTELWTSPDRAVVKLALPHEAARYSSYPPALAVCALALRRDGVIRRVARIGALRQCSSNAAAWCEIVPGGDGGSLRFFDDAGGVVAEVRDLLLVEDMRDRLPPRSEWCYDIAWTDGPHVDLTATPADARWMVIGGDDRLTGHLCDRLTSAGVDNDRIDASSIDGIATIIRDHLDPDAQARPLSNIVYVVASDEADDESIDTAIDTALVRTTRLLTLIRAVAEEAWSSKVATPPKIWLISRAAMPAGSDDVSPGQSALWGMMKTVAAELPAFYGGIVDLDPAPASSDDEAQQIVGAISGSGDETWLAVRGGEPRVARLRPDPPALDRPPLALRADGAYVVTGGFGALGMATARWLVDRGARRLVLLGRTPIPPRAEWAGLRSDDPALTRVAAIRELEALGATVHHPAVDVADRDALQAMLDDHRSAGWPPIRGVFHAAGELRDRSIPQMDDADVATVFGSKARGAWNLHLLLADEPLDHFVCYSSVAAAVGSPGQANYAAANGFLDGLVHLRRAQGRPGLSVNWGPWSAGMAAAEEVERLRERRGVQPIPVLGGLAVLGELLAADTTQAVVMPMTPAQWTTAVASPLVADLVSEHSTATGPVDDIRADLLSRPADERAALVLETVRIEVGAVAGLGVDDVPAEFGLIEVGLDSIMIVELATTLSRRFAVALDPREIFEEPSLATLASTLLAAVDAGSATPADHRGPDPSRPDGGTQPRGSGCTIIVTTPAAGAAEIRALIAQIAPDALVDPSWSPSVDALDALRGDHAVHVSESLADDPDALEALAEQAPGIGIVHLTRHPFAVIEELVDEHGLSQRDAEEVWTTVNGNLLDLVDRVGHDRLLVLRFEDLVTDPSATIAELVRFGALAHDDRSDVEHPAVEPDLAQRWMSATLTQRPGRGVRRVAEDLGYDARWPVDVHGGHPDPVTPVTPVVAAEGAAAPDAPIPAVPRSQRIQASPAQGRLLFLDEFFPGLAVYNLPVALRLEGNFDRGAWTSSLTEIVRRHEILRTNYESVDGVYVQLIEPPSPIEVRYEDLRDLPPADLDETIEREVAAEVATPFDLAHDLKLRAAVFQVGDDVHVVVLTMHHIASDGWSVLRTIGELITLYRASISGGVAALPEPTIHYADYAAWQRDRLQSPALQQQLAYWTEQLAGDLPVLELPTDRPRPTPRSYRADVHLFEVPGDLADAIRAHGRTAGATPFMTLLAAYAATLARYTGQRDVIIGTANANRQRPELTDLIGLFVNTLALRVVVDPDAPFDELLGRVRRVALDANRNQDVPFDRIVEAVRPPRDVSRSPIYQTMFTLHNMRPVEVQLPGVEVEALPVSTGELDVDLSIELTDVGGATGGAMQGMLRFNADLFDPVSVERLVGSWLSLLGSVVADGSVPVGSVDLVGDDDVESVERWNGTEVDFGDEGGLRVEELFAAQVERSPDAVAVATGDTECSFVELDAASNRLARRLSTAGVAPGDVVGVGVDRSVSMVVALLAVMKTGAAYVPLDPGFPAQRLSFMVSDAGVSVVVTSGSALLDRLGADDAAIVEGLSVIDVLADADEIEAESADPVEIAGSGGAGLDPRGLAYLIYTSGSTGVPKGVQIEHRNVVNFLLSMREQPGLSADDVLLAVTTLSFDISVLEIFLPLVTGARLVLARTDDSIDGARLARLITDSQATVMQATPTTWSMLIEAGWDGEASLKVLCGGEAMSRWLADELVSRCGELWNMFGPTETTIWSTLMRIQPDDADTVPIGAPIANTVCRILDPNGVQQPVGVPGELHIGGAGVARGYLDRPELTAERFIADPYSDDPNARLYRTGDLARWRNDGRIDFAGRLDHQVKVRGHRIELGEIETALRDHDDIGDAVVIVREDQPGDQRITAYLTAPTTATTTTGEGDTAPTPDTGELRRYLAGTLPAYMIPSTFVTLDEFPLTPNRKIDRNVLPAPRLDTPTITGDHVEPTTDLEHVVAGMFASLLGVEPIGTTDNFFELGGHSLLATSFAARLRAVFGIDLDLRIFFQDATVAAVVAHFSEDDDERKRIERIARIELQLASLTPDQVATLLAAKRDERGGGTER